MSEQLDRLEKIVANLATSVEGLMANQSARASSQTDSARLYYSRDEPRPMADIPERPMGRTVKNTPKYTFDEMVKKHSKSLSVGKPFLDKGGKAFILKMEHIGCDKHPNRELSKAFYSENGFQCPECKEQWKALAYAGKYTSTRRFGNIYTTYIKVKYEDNVFKILKKFNVHIPELTKKEVENRKAIIAEALASNKQKLGSKGSS